MPAPVPVAPLPPVLAPVVVTKKQDVVSLPAPRVSAVGTWPAKARTGATVKISFRLNVASTVKLQLLHGKQQRVAKAVRLTPGTRTLGLVLVRGRTRIAPGSYTLVLTVTANGTSATIKRALRVTAVPR